jgi:hypothetical protein
MPGMKSAGYTVRWFIGLDSGRAFVVCALARFRLGSARGTGAGGSIAHPGPIVPDPFMICGFAQPQTAFMERQEKGVTFSFVQFLKEKRSPRRTRRPAARAREEKRGKPRAIQAYGPQSCRARLGFRAAAYSALESGFGRRSKRDGPRWFSNDPSIVFLRVALRQACVASPSRFPFFAVAVSSGGKPPIRYPLYPDWVFSPASEGLRS